MHGAAESPAVFDGQVRDQIRRKLHHYMRAHRIGVPTLARRIHDGAPRKQDIPVKTLQRFLAGHMRTTDPYIALFAHFTNGMPETDPIGALGKSLADLFKSSQSNEYSGDYKSQLSHPFHPNKGVLFGETLIHSDDRFCRIVESMDYISCTKRFEGVLISVGKAAILSLVDVVTLATKTYHLSHSGGTMGGVGTTLEAVFHPNEPDPELVIEHVSVMMGRQ